MRGTGEQMQGKITYIHSCQNCKWYCLDERVDDEKGKHLCYGHTLIASALHFANSVDEENLCKNFVASNGETHDEQRNLWLLRGFRSDETIEMLYGLMSGDDGRD